MFRLLPTTKCKRQQIAILIISFFAYVAGIRNENNNMLLLRQQQQLQQQQQQHMTIENNSNYKRSLTSNHNPVADIKQQTNLYFRTSPIIDFTTADATVPKQYKPTYIDGAYPNINTATFNTNAQIQQNDNRRYTTTTYGNIAEKQFSFPNEQQQESLQQQIPQQLTDRPIYIYRDPYTNENYHYTPTEPIIQDTTYTPPYNHNNYNGNGNKQQQEHPHHNNQQEYLVQSSMIVGTHQNKQQQQLQQQHPYMSLSDDKDVYLKRPGLVYDEKTSYNHPNSVIDKKSGEAAQTVKANKISYDSHDYPPPSYFQQQTSNFLPTPVPDVIKPMPTPRPVPRPTSPPRQEYRPPSSTPSQLFGHQQQQYLQSSQSSLPNYANNIDTYLSNKQQSDYYRTETPPHTYLQHKQQYETIPPFGVQQQQEQYESRPPPSYQQQYETRPPPYQQQQQYESKPPPSYQQQYESRPPSFNQVVTQQSYYPQYETTLQQPQTSLQRPPSRPSYNNYYDYQIGEVPPQTQTSLLSSQNFNYPYPRPPPSQYTHQGAYRPPVPPTQQQSGLATLAQYAPQFTQLLLGGGGGGTSSNTNSPLGSLIGALTGATTSQQPHYTSSSPSSSSYNRRPVNSQLIRALENIARNDDLQCVPKVLCQMIAAQTQRGQLPTFITSPTITNFLAGFPAASPALIYGRAALLGLSGGEKSCHQTYVKCPKNEYEIIYYLNNHRGGFFKFFSEPEEQQNNENNDSTQQGGASSLFSILAALTGSPQQVITTTPRPTPKPQAPSADITSGIGNFFTQLLSDYMGGATVEYQRRRKRRTRRSVGDKIIFEDNTNIIKFKDDDNNNEDNVDEVGEDFHDEEDTMDTQQGIEFRDEEEENKEDEEYNSDDTQSRILHKPGFRGKQVKFFPELQETLSENEKDQHLKAVIQKFNDYNKGRKLKFPTATDERQYLDVAEDAVRQGKELSDLSYGHEQKYGYQYTNYIEESYDPLHRDSKKIKFLDDNEEQEQSLYSDYLAKPENTKTKFVFPQRIGKILNNRYYASTYSYYDQEQDDKFVLPNTQRPSSYTEFPQTSSANVYNTHINSINSQNSFTSSSSINNNYYGSSSEPHTNSNSNHFLPTPPPDTSSNSIYSSNNNNYNSNHNYHKPQRYPASSSYNTNHNKYHSNHYTDRYHSSLYTTRRPYTTTTKKSDDKNIYITNSRGVTEYYITPDGRKVYL